MKGVYRGIWVDVELWRKVKAECNQKGITIAQFFDKLLKAKFKETE